MAGNIALAHNFGEGEARHSRQFTRLTKRQDVLRVKRQSQFRPEPRFDLGYRKPEAPRDGFGNIDVVGQNRYPYQRTARWAGAGGRLSRLGPGTLVKVRFGMKPLDSILISRRSHYPGVVTVR